MALHTPTEDPQTVVQTALDDNDVDGKLIGVEPTQMRVLEWNLLKQAAGEIKQTSAAEAIKQLRMTKDADEVAEMRKAVEIAQQALTDTLPLARAFAALDRDPSRPGAPRYLSRISPASPRSTIHCSFAISLRTPVDA